MVTGAAKPVKVLSDVERLVEYNQLSDKATDCRILPLLPERAPRPWFRGREGWKLDSERQWRRWKKLGAPAGLCATLGSFLGPFWALFGSFYWAGASRPRRGPLPARPGTADGDEREGGDWRRGTSQVFCRGEGGLQDGLVGIVRAWAGSVIGVGPATAKLHISANGGYTIRQWSLALTWCSRCDGRINWAVELPGCDTLCAWPDQDTVFGRNNVFFATCPWPGDLL